MLLLRFGISTRIVPVGNSFELLVEGVDEQRRFLQEIHLPRTSGEERILERVRAETRARDAAAVDPTLQDGLRSAAGHGEPLGRVATVLADADLELDAVNDVLWDVVMSVEPDGVEEVYDATVLNCHNFVVNGVAAHNSIEQDADMVILLHREDSFNKESERAGEADVIVAKHRNGPTDTIVLAFQGHYSRFTNMAQSF